MPAWAGTPRDEKPELRFYAADSHGGFCHAHPPPQRGTGPSPRVVFDRATFPFPALLDSRLRGNDEGGAGTTCAGAVVCGHSRGHVPSFCYQSLIPAGAGTPRYESRRCELAVVFVCRSRHTPPQAGDKPPPYISPSYGPRTAISPVQLGSSQRDCRANPPCRQGPAHQGMKIGALVGGSSIRCLGT